MSEEDRMRSQVELIDRLMVELQTWRDHISEKLSDTELEPKGEVTIEDLREKMTQMKDLGGGRLVKFIQSFGVGKVSELPQEKYQDFYEAAEKLLADAS